MSKDKTIKKTIIVALVAALLLFLKMISGILLPFVMGIVIAYLLNPATEKLTGKWVPRSAAAAIALIGFFVAAITIIMLLFPLLKTQTVVFSQKIPDYAAALWDRLEPIVASIKENAADNDINIDIKASLAKHAEYILRFVIEVFTGIITSSVALFNFIGLFLITPVVAFYLLRDWKNFTKSAENLIPEKNKKETREIFKKIDGALAGWIRGQLAVCCALALFYAVSLSIVGLDVAIAVGVFTGLMTAIPYIGWSLGTLCGIGAAFAQYGDAPAMIMIVAGIFLLGQIIESNILTPNLIGGSINLHPVWMMFALLAGGSLCGFVGFLLAIPVAAVAAVLIRHFLSRIVRN